MTWEDRDWAPRPERMLGGRFSDNPLNWAPSIFRVAGIRVRVHITFILLIVFELLSAGAFAAFTAQWLLVLFGSVLLHEFGHCFAARRMRGSASDVLMWPLGGLAFVEAPMYPWPQFVTTVGGPAVNVVLAVASLLLLQFDVFANPWQFFTPVAGSWTQPFVWLRVIYECNMALLIFNMWPMYPMDAGRMLKSVLWWRMGLGRATLITATVGMVAAVIMGLYLLAIQSYLLLAIPILGYLTCYQERVYAKFSGMRASEGFGGDDLSGNYSTVDSARPPRRVGLLTQWRRLRAEARRKKEAERIETQEREIDRILEKIHRQGLHSLTRLEKRTLEQASQDEHSSRRNRL